MKDIFSIMHDRRSIRKFTDKEITKEVFEQILTAGFRAPFAAQLCSIVYTSDKEKMKKFKGIGVYPTTQILMIFFIDYDRMEKIIKARGYENIFDDSMSLWLGIQDVSLVIENVILAAEALDLGSVLLGVFPQKADLVSEVFNVPQRVFPVVGLCLGYPDPSVETEIRPRYPLKYSAFKDEYKALDETEIKECMKSMDEGYITQGYYIKNKAKIPLPEDKEDTIDYDKYSWSEHISRKHLRERWGDDTLINIIRKHGFNIE
ncbi:MAG: nitroreductase family protein [Candidatus Heimdallarchaeota archaeon]